MICPNCGKDVDLTPPPIAPPLAICPACGRTVVVIEGTTRIAHGDDTTHLTEAQILGLKKLRPAT